MLIEKETKEKVKNDYNEGKIKCRIKTYLTGKVKMLNFRGVVSPPGLPTGSASVYLYIEQLLHTC